MDVRVRDPASRDQDPVPWRSGRFAERVRREWNPVTDAEIAAAGLSLIDAAQAVHAGREGHGDETHHFDLEALAAAIHAHIGGDLAPILERLHEFAAMEAQGAPAAPDPLVRPGAN